MSRDLTSNDSLELRLQALETSNRRYRLGALAAVLLAAFACLGDDRPVTIVAASAPPEQADVVEASAFVLRGPDGAVAARLDWADGGPRLALYSEPEVVGALLRTEPRSSELRFDTAGKRRAHLQANADLNSGRFGFYADDGKPMAAMQTESGASNFGLWGESNEKGVRSMLNVGMPPVGPPAILLRDADQKTRVYGMDD